MKNTPFFDDNDIIILDIEELENSDIQDQPEFEVMLADGDIPF